MVVAAEKDEDWGTLARGEFASASKDEEKIPTSQIRSTKSDSGSENGAKAERTAGGALLNE